METKKLFIPFLHEIKSNHTPLIEQCPADNQYKLITYIWLGDQNTENVYVFGSFPGWDLSVNQLQRLLQTDIWYVTFRTDKSFISTYYFSVNDVFENDWIKRSEQYEIDQFNRNTFGEGTNKASVLNIGMEVQYSSRFPSNIRMKIILVLSLKKQKRKGLLIIYLVKGNLLILIKIFRTILKSNFIEL